LNSQTTVAVAALPLFTPEIVIVSACAVAETTAKMLTALNEIKNFRNRAISPPCTRTYQLEVNFAYTATTPRCILIGRMRVPHFVSGEAEDKTPGKTDQYFATDVTESPQSQH
jgi:hypothetical protein